MSVGPACASPGHVLIDVVGRLGARVPTIDDAAGVMPVESSVRGHVDDARTEQRRPDDPQPPSPIQKVGSPERRKRRVRYHPPKRNVSVRPIPYVWICSGPMWKTIGIGRIERC